MFAMFSTPATHPPVDCRYPDLVDYLQAKLRDAAAQRPQRNTIDETGVPAWVAHERHLMHQAVNTERARRGLPAVDIVDIESAEATAVGHSDYTLKFAIRCADLITN